jgi:hypothetical protein
LANRITKITSKEQLKEISLESFLNNTNEVTKVSQNSVLSAIAYMNSTVGQKSLVEVAAIESFLFPDTAVSTQLDQIALDRGISARFGSSSSSTYLRISADSGTTYTSGVHTFTGTHGVVFALDANITVGLLGFAYAKVSSTTSGANANVSPLTINTVSPEPIGHVVVINEYAALGGRDNESDDLFRKRIKQGVNILARGTISSLEQAFMKINNNVLKVFNQGINSNSNLQLAISTQNGVDLTSNELLELLDSTQDFFSITELRPFGSGYFGIDLVNIDYDPIDLNFRVVLDAGYNPDTYRIDVQSKISKYLDFRTFESEVDLVEWDDLLEIAKNTKGAKYIPDEYFFLNSKRVDYKVDRSKLPRVRSFSMFDASGSLIQDLSGNLSPVFYPNQVNLNFQLTALKSIS